MTHGLCRKRDCLNATESLGEPREHHEVGVKPDALDAPNAERSEAVVVLQAAELALDGGAASVELAPPERLARDQRVQAVSLDPPARGLALASRAAPLRGLPLEVGTREGPDAVLTAWRLVVALVSPSRSHAQLRSEGRSALVARSVEYGILT